MRQRAAHLRTLEHLLGTHPVVGVLGARQVGKTKALHTGAKLDLLVVRGNRRIGFEIKRTTAPRVTPSMRSALDELRLQRLYVVHAGDASFPMSESIQAIPLARAMDELEPLR